MKSLFISIIINYDDDDDDNDDYDDFVFVQGQETTLLCSKNQSKGRSWLLCLHFYFMCIMVASYCFLESFNMTLGYPSLTAVTGCAFIVQFFLELMKVPRVESKLRVFSFKIQFNAQVICTFNFNCYA